MWSSDCLLSPVKSYGIFPGWTGAFFSDITYTLCSYEFSPGLRHINAPRNTGRYLRKTAYPKTRHPICAFHSQLVQRFSVCFRIFPFAGLFDRRKALSQETLVNDFTDFVAMSCFQCSVNYLHTLFWNVIRGKERKNEKGTNNDLRKRLMVLPLSGVE